MKRLSNVTTGQIRAALALLGVEQEALGRGVGVSVATLRRVETGNAPPETIHRAVEGLEMTGIRLVEDGVQLRPTATERVERKRRVADILARFDSAPDLAPGFTDASLYDENGLPG
jgi:transcriptional regulator with XRE-family HTH domain